MTMTLTFTSNEVIDVSSKNAFHVSEVSQRTDELKTTNHCFQVDFFQVIIQYFYFCIMQSLLFTIDSR